MAVWDAAVTAAGVLLGCPRCHMRQSAWPPRQAWSLRFCPASGRPGLHEWGPPLLAAGDMAFLSHAQLQGQQIAALAHAAVAAGNVPLLQVVIQLSGFTNDMGAALQLPQLLPHLNLGLLEWLGDRGADLHKPDDDGHTLLLEASTPAAWLVVTVGRAHGAAVNGCEWYCGRQHKGWSRCDKGQRGALLSPACRTKCAHLCSLGSIQALQCACGSKPHSCSLGNQSVRCEEECAVCRLSGSATSLWRCT